MRLKRTGNYTRAIASPLVGLVLVGVEATIVKHVITRASAVHFDQFTFALCCVSAACWAVAIIMPAALVLAPIRLIRRERKLRAAARDDDARTPPAPTQPDPHEAIAPGATVTLTRVAQGSVAISIFGAIVTTVLYALASLIGLIQVIPTVTTWLMRAVFPVSYLPKPPTPTLLDWLTFAYPLAFSLALGVVILWGGLSNRAYTINANDGGITVRRSLRRPRFIPWNDIDVFLKLPRPQDDRFIDIYLLHGTEHSLTFFLTGAYWERAFFAHPAGYVRYAADARALLATIIARSYTPLRLYDQRAISQPSPAFLPDVTSTATDAVAAPTPATPLDDEPAD